MSPPPSHQYRKQARVDKSDVGATEIQERAYMPLPGRPAAATKSSHPAPQSARSTAAATTNTPIRIDMTSSLTGCTAIEVHDPIAVPRIAAVSIVEPGRDPRRLSVEPGAAAAEL